MINLDDWRRDPISFIETVLHDPETTKPFVLLDAEKRFLELAFATGDHGKLRYPEQVYACPKKSGKTGFAAMHVLVITLLFGGAYPEAVCVANDFEQAQGRVFQAIKRIVECSPQLRAAARITADRISFPDADATIAAIASDYAGAAGGNQNIAVFDELWGYTSERSRRLWDEMIPPPTRRLACRLTVTYAGFSGESQLLEELYKRGMAQPEVGPDLRAGDGILCFWSHVPIAPWQDEAWLAEMRRSLRPLAFLRQIENRFVTTESGFIDLEWWDQCVDPAIKPILTNQLLTVCVGVDASVKRDSTALVATTFDRQVQAVRLVCHRVFQPSPDDPMDFETSIEATLLDWHAKFSVRQVLYDPFQMHATAQRLKHKGVRMEEYPQSVPNLTEASQHLYELIKGRNLIAYPDADLRLALSHAVAVETARGQRIAKDKQTHKVDVVIALSMAALASVKTHSSYDIYALVGGSDVDLAKQNAEWRWARYAEYVETGAYRRPW